MQLIVYSQNLDFWQCIGTQCSGTVYLNRYMPALHLTSLQSIAAATVSSTFAVQRCSTNAHHLRTSNLNRCKCNRPKGRLNGSLSRGCHPCSTQESEKARHGRKGHVRTRLECLRHFFYHVADPTMRVENPRVRSSRNSAAFRSFSVAACVCHTDYSDGKGGK